MSERGVRPPWTLMTVALAFSCEPSVATKAERPQAWLAAMAPAPTEPSPAEVPAARGGYWLSADLVGPAAAQKAATIELGDGLRLEDPIDVMPPGIVVGHVAQVQTAMEWIDLHAFEPRSKLPTDPHALHQAPAPIPGGRVEKHGATVAAFIVSGATPQLRQRSIEWPVDQSSILPTGIDWLPAATIPDRAPLFAAPAPALPPAAERHGMARRRGGLFVLGWFDRCLPNTTRRRCMRWAQVIARDGDRFTTGYLPMAQVAIRDAWVEGSQPLPRAQLIRTGLVAGRAQWLLLARGVDNQLHRKTIEAAANETGWPTTTLSIEGEDAILSLGAAAPVRVRLDASLDARPPRGAEPATTAETNP